MEGKSRYPEIIDWTTRRERREIAKTFGVTSDRQVYSIIHGDCKNFPLLDALIKKAEYNKSLEQRARQLTA